MRARLSQGVLLRKDSFGGVCYVPHRDDFFAANHEVFTFLKGLGRDWITLDEAARDAATALARLGICETTAPSVKELAYSGPSFLGEFPELPSVSIPLVLNLFCTAHCPLKCVYCHADDLMQGYRSTEVDQDLENVAATASIVPAMVAVITGGDPLTRPKRARYLIERLSSQKALVMDTSGVGDIDELLPCLKEHRVHVRVSLDAISEVNHLTRPGNPIYGYGRGASFEGASRTISRCLEQGLPVTVQTVVSARNENPSELRDLRDWLLNRGVQNWVLHVAVKGGSARRIEVAARKHARPRGILPSRGVYDLLWMLVEETQRNRLPIDIRCTDTDTTPNSVLLIGSKGDLYTEGYAHNGKVQLFSANNARPDLSVLWPHLDRFGHARRYLNWNPWFFGGKSIEAICYRVPVPTQTKSKPPRPVETEAKFRVPSPDAMRTELSRLGYTAGQTMWQRDEYFDTEEAFAARLDYVIRLREDETGVRIALKGPRFYTPEGDYSRIELEVSCADEPVVRAELTASGFNLVWYFEKRRVEYTKEDSSVVVALDEVPDAGFFLEFEGSPTAIQRLAAQMHDKLGTRETRNYKDVYLDYMQNLGVEPSLIRGATFKRSEEVSS